MSTNQLEFKKKSSLICENSLISSTEVIPQIVSHIHNVQKLCEEVEWIKKENVALKKRLNYII